ncbi:MAG: aconitase X [Myxococcota bacterium]|jgi:hypothetical protein
MGNMKLTFEEQEILGGSRGEAMANAMKSVVVFGEAFGAKSLVELTGAPHAVTSFGIGFIKPYFRMLDELVSAGLHTFKPFTVDPRPMDFVNVPVSLVQKALFLFTFSKQQQYERQLRHLGLRDPDAFSCACYLPEVGNTPRRGDLLAWSESSAVVFANSVLGARSNRNSAGIDMLCSITGRAPLFGLLTDEGREASWQVEVKTSKLPNAQLLGSAIGLKVVEDVPYVVGLDAFLGSGLNNIVRDYLKDMGAAMASNGAVGLYHAEGLTPEARDMGRTLLRHGYRTLVIDDAHLERVMAGYPEMWRNKKAHPKRCFIGCPHLSLSQLERWTHEIPAALAASGRSRTAVDTVLCAPPQVVERFFSDGGNRAALLRAGIRVTSLCPLMYMSNPLCSREPVLTNSNKLRTFSTARFLRDEDVLKVVAGGGR